MRSTIYAVVAACVAMLATSGIVALATAASAELQISAAERELDQAQLELADHLDTKITAELAGVRDRLAVKLIP